MVGCGGGGGGGRGGGGVVALYAAAFDTRIDVACVSGYFDSRQNIWQEPIDRNIFGLLEQFGDAGFENVDSKSLALPFLKVLGQLSPQVTQGDSQFMADA